MLDRRLTNGTEIRAVSFDVGGTLIEPWPSVGHVYAEVAGRFDINGIPPEDLNRRFRAAWKSRQAFDYSRSAWHGLVTETFAGLCPRPPGPECFAAIYDAFAGAARWRIFDDVLPTLAAARERGWKLAIVSNWDERLRPLLRALQLIDQFDVIVASHDAGWAKPSPEIFRRAASELKTPPESVLHVGDRDVEDRCGARSAGMRSLLIDRRLTQRDPDAVQTLAAVLDGWGGSAATGSPD